MSQIVKLLKQEVEERAGLSFGILNYFGINFDRIAFGGILIGGGAT
jgi:hypothetical protein